MRPCISFAIVGYHWSAPASAPGSSVERSSGAARRAASVAPALRGSTSARTPPSYAIGASSFLNGRVETTIYPHNPTRVRTHPEAEAALDVKTKKRNTNPKVCISKNCQAPPGNSREAETRESTKQRGEALKLQSKFDLRTFRKFENSSIENVRIRNHQIQILINFFSSPLCFMNTLDSLHRWGPHPGSNPRANRGAFGIKTPAFISVRPRRGR